jgi:ribose transport system substrate-binding protein
MSRKRLLVALAVCALVLGACGGDGGGGGGGAGGGGGGQYKLTFIQGVKGDEFYITMNCGVQEAARQLGATVNVQGPDQFDATLQTPIVNAVTAQKPDAVLIAPNDAKAMMAPLLQMKQAGIKIVLVDTTLERPEAVAESAIASDNLEGGVAAADALAKLIGGPGNVMVINVKPGISTTDLRAQGFEQGIKKHANIKYIGQEYSQNDPVKAAGIATATLAKDPNLKGIFATNLFSAEGAATGLRSSGKQAQVKIVGFDAGPAQVKALKEGVVQALVMQKPAEIGRLGVEQAIKALKGEPTTKQIPTGFVVATRENMNDPEVSRWFYKSDC